MNFVILSGQSGAGKSQAKKAFEDFGYYCVDNLPPSLIPNFIELLEQSAENIMNIALVIDIRGGKFFKDLEHELNLLDEKGYSYSIFYFEADDDVLLKRYKEARRSHPFDPNARIKDAIQGEKQCLEALRHRSDFVINTSHKTQAQLKETVLRSLDTGSEQPQMSMTFLSFGFKKGVPLDADFIFDVRFLPNPFYVEELRHLTGNQEEVRSYVMKFKESQIFFQHIVDMLDYAIPHFTKDGRSQLVIAVGCTGGQHRSVSFTNELSSYYKERGHHIFTVHRDARVVKDHG